MQTPHERSAGALRRLSGRFWRAVGSPRHPIARALWAIAAVYFVFNLWPAFSYLTDLRAPQFDAENQMDLWIVTQPILGTMRALADILFVIAWLIGLAAVIDLLDKIRSASAGGDSTKIED